MKTVRGLMLFFGAVCSSSIAGAQAGTTMLVKTDSSCLWKLDGQAMGVLKAGFSTVVLVSPGEHLIEAAATVGAATLRTEVKVEAVEKTVDLQLKGRNDQQTKMLPAKPLKKLTATEAAQQPTWTDAATGLMWTGKDNGSDVDWRQAKAYCGKLQYAGYDGWRLPTTDELQGIYDPSAKARKTFGHVKTYDVYVKGDLAITGNVWSGSDGTYPGKPYEGSWEFTFMDVRYRSLPNPMPNFTHFDYDMRALCVRGAGS